MTFPIPNKTDGNVLNGGDIFKMVYGGVPEGGSYYAISGNTVSSGIMIFADYTVVTGASAPQTGTGYLLVGSPAVSVREQTVTNPTNTDQDSFTLQYMTTSEDWTNDVYVIMAGSADGNTSVNKNYLGIIGV